MRPEFVLAATSGVIAANPHAVALLPRVSSLPPARILATTSRPSRGRADLLSTVVDYFGLRAGTSSCSRLLSAPGEDSRAHGVRLRAPPGG